MKKVLLAVISAGIGFIGGMFALVLAYREAAFNPEKVGKKVIFENDDIKVIQTSDKEGGWGTASVIYKN